MQIEKQDQDIKQTKGDDMEEVGENTFLKLREEKLRLKEELEQVKYKEIWH